ncbi:phosphopantothenoylcysteine decarboxylase/phosphopantothenate--cysteine ligase [Gemella haemolysans]|jgi:phosphopantothenoylcysteine decarboxylase/phosphopantothenate--cysteine ligase|uniref:Coenzyme A biosynthesis bifunctional protein CoaBC n=1 Tax=Gemella haemolysans TaxID=1379 RepID=A0A133ZQ87_9BACL|nr:bifunctional phosphopantothenoylcysteine decarboxylase/phosphopantothenate--cysteine ligase CoaBC [Gemella haemolysans]KXB57629.1 phosphopantothenoylcysteine decarboxylase/phosphopantothenate--cysteine ligase [Gemella haemolysans]MDU6767028.1 bifunctional phosphopantothenoylcysteine decarboxylase/phosphopantothenate--cysteine ligase CoaBC [Gemella haemolysans]TKW63957.1 MAG: bifunctional phosphopantothenoylcysteine decarboxylase/phosphopantothenate--cysteine ligase CoaBC [Gemella sp.]
MNILLIVSGGIAAYKSIELCSSLVKQGNNVKVILTKNAENFVTQLPFQTLTKNRVYTSTFEEIDENEIQHIDLTKWADKIIVAPATANLISKFANGIADDLATSLMLAVRDTSIVYIVPAMNTFMYRNPIIQDNMNKLIKLGFNFVKPDSGLLACGDVGEGKFPSIEKIESFVFQEVEQNLKGKKVLVTAGPTKEFIDPFRCLTNPSTGKMGISIANECARRGAEVILVSSVDNDTISSKVKKIKITSTNDMFEVVKNNFKDCDFIIKAAAVSDYTPVQVFDKKVKKQDGNLTIEFQRTQDILKYVGDNKTDKQKVIGFAAETNNLIEYAKEKIVKKNLDFIVANDISKKDIGFGSDDNEVYIIDKHDNIKKIDKSNKNNIAKAIVDEISK